MTTAARVLIATKAPGEAIRHLVKLPVTSAIGWGLFAELIEERGGLESAVAFLVDLATAAGRPVLVNVPSGEGSTTVLLAPRGWGDERLRGWAGGLSGGLEALFGPAEFRGAGGESRPVLGESMDRPPCGAKLERGGVCRAFALEGGRCWNHAPDREEERRAARSKGGKLRAIQGRRSRLVTVPELLRFNADVVHRAISGELPPDLARVAIYGLTLQRALIESGDLAKRLEALEQRLAEQGAKRWA